MPLYITADNRFEAKQQQNKKTAEEKLQKQMSCMQKYNENHLFYSVTCETFKKKKRSKTTLTLAEIKSLKTKFKKKTKKKNKKKNRPR